MITHDPLCPRHMLTALERPDDQCLCGEYARVRADERKQVGRVWAKREDLLLGDIEVARADERAGRRMNRQTAVIWLLALMLLVLVSIAALRLVQPVPVVVNVDGSICEVAS